MLSADKVIAPAAASACCPLFSRTRVLEGSGSEEEPPWGGFPAAGGSSLKWPPERSPDPRARQSARRERRGGSGPCGGSRGRRSAPPRTDSPAGARLGSCEHNQNEGGEV